MYTEENPAYGVPLGMRVRHKPSRMADSSPAQLQEPVYEMTLVLIIEAIESDNTFVLSAKTAKSFLVVMG